MEINTAEARNRMCNLTLKMTKYLNDDDCDNHRCFCEAGACWGDLNPQAIEAIEKAVEEKYGVTNEIE